MTTSGIDELREAVASVGLSIELDPAEGIVLVVPPESRILLEVQRLALATPETLSRRITKKSTSTAVTVLVADRLTEAAREMLAEAGWGWLDLRGRLHIVAKGLYLDAAIPEQGSVATSQVFSPMSKVLASASGREVAVQLLLEPQTPASVRQIARTISRSASTVSQTLRAMERAALIDENRRPINPFLFDELALHWPQQPQVDIQSLPSPKDLTVHRALRTGIEDGDTTGWAMTETVAAARYGAPVAIRTDYPPEFYLPDESILRRSGHLLGISSDREHRAATLRLSPVPAICTQRVHVAGEAWPLAHPLFVALDLAQDPARGREILNGWTPGSAGIRVW